MKRWALLLVGFTAITGLLMWHWGTRSRREPTISITNIEKGEHSFQVQLVLHNPTPHTVVLPGGRSDFASCAVECQTAGMWERQAIASFTAPHYAFARVPSAESLAFSVQIPIVQSPWRLRLHYVTFAEENSDQMAVYRQKVKSIVTPVQ